MAARRLVPALLCSAALAVLPLAVLPLTVSAQGSVGVTTATTIGFSTPRTADYDVGWVEHLGFTVSVQSKPGTRSWVLSIRAADAMLGPGKPTADLLWREGSSGTWLPLSVIDAPVLQGAGDRDVVLHFRLVLDWSRDAPGTYSTDVHFTVLRL